MVYRNISARLKEYMEKTRESLRNAENILVCDFGIMEAILQPVLEMIGNAKSNGVSIV